MIRLVLRIPVAAIEKLESEELTVNSQISDILETFDYNLIPNGSNFGYDVRQHQYQRLTITLPKIAGDRFRKYCHWTGKSQTVAISQVLMIAGKYKV